MRGILRASPGFANGSLPQAGLLTAAVIYISADLFISPRVRGANRRRIAKFSEKTSISRRAGGRRGAKNRPFHARQVPISGPFWRLFEKSSRSAVWPAGREFGPFLARRRFIVS
jgi:hypothetical protein